MEPSTLISIVINLLVLGCLIYTSRMQKQKIDALTNTVNSLKETISAQEKVVSAMVKWNQIIDVEKLFNNVKALQSIIELKAQEEHELEKKEFIKQFKNEEIIKDQKIRERFDNLINRYFDALSFSLRTLYYVHQDDRESLLNEITLPKHREMIGKHLETIKDVYIWPKKYTLFFFIQNQRDSNNP